MKTLLILNTFYPFARNEDYLANELKYLHGFDEVVIAPSSINEPVPDNLYNNSISCKYLINRRSYKDRRIPLLLKTFLSKDFYREIYILIKSRKLSLDTIKMLLGFLLYSYNSYQTISNYISNNQNKEIYLYSYWLHTSAFIGCLLKSRYKNIVKVISRCHRFDIYEYASPHGYIPMRRYILSNIDKIYSISNDAINYLTSRYPEYSQKYQLSRLGTVDYGFLLHEKTDVLKIVSCSWLRPVKRVDLIMDAIENLDIPVEWTHFGDGELYDYIFKRAQAIDNKNIRVCLKGNCKNVDVIEAYNTQSYDVFINVSESEGVPVSIMEAMSCGLIIVATDVGGTSEIVDENNGFLLPVDFKIKELSMILKIIYNMNSEQYRELSYNSRLKWEKNVSASRNYIDFYANLLGS